MDQTLTWQIISTVTGFLFLISEVLGKSSCPYNGVFEFVIGNMTTTIHCSRPCSCINREEPSPTPSSTPILAQSAVK